MQTPTQPQEFNLKQRELFSKLLAQAKTRAQEEMERDSSAADEKVRDEILPRLAKEYGASELISNVQRLHTELGDAETALRKIGFRCADDGDIVLHYEAPKALREALEKAKRSAKKERDEVLRKFDLAIVAVLASEDIKEAKTIVEGLL